jgi:hypothetical protein
VGALSQRQEPAGLVILEVELEGAASGEAGAMMGGAFEIAHPAAREAQDVGELDLGQAEGMAQAAPVGDAATTRSPVCGFDRAEEWGLRNWAKHTLSNEPRSVLAY